MTQTQPKYAAVHAVDSTTGKTTLTADLEVDGVLSPAGGSAAIFTTTASGSGNVSGTQSVLTVTPGAAYTGQRQAYWGLLTLTGSGALHTSVQTACAELWCRNSTTGGLTQTVYAVEATFDNQSASSVASAYAFQANWRNLGGGNVSNAVCVRAVYNPGATGTTTNLSLFLATMDVSAGSAPCTVINGYNSVLLFASGSGTDTAGGYTVRGALFEIPVQGGNTAGSNNNFGFQVLGGAGGTPAGGTVNNYGGYIAVPNPASGTGNQTNYGLRISGNGTAVVAGVTNYAFYADSTAASLFGGPLQVNSASAFAGTSTTALNVSASTTHSVGATQSWDGVKVAGTFTLTGTTHDTLITGVNMVTLAQPTITNASVDTVDFAATLAIGGAPLAGGSQVLTNTYALWSQGGLNRFDGPILANHVTTAAINSTNTATAAQVATGWITSTSAALTSITFPTGTALGAALAAVQGTEFDLVIDNTAGANTVTMVVNTNAILSAMGGTLTVPSGATGLAKFHLMFNSATTYTITRVA